MMKHWSGVLLTMLLTLGLMSCAADSGVAPSSSSSVSASEAGSSSAVQAPEAPSMDRTLSAPPVQAEEEALLDALWTRLNADEWDEKCWMSGRNLIYFVRENRCV